MSIRVIATTVACALGLSSALVSLPLRAGADEVLVAVATNFAAVVQELEPDFEARTGHDLRMTSASTGKLYAQILHGAPFDVLMAADQIRPARLVEAGLARGSSQRTYASGQLVLWSRDARRVREGGREALLGSEYRRLAIANPELAPYGAAAIEVLRALGAEEELRSRLVIGENIAQAYALVATGNAELGFVAASQLEGAPLGRRGSAWPVPSKLHAPIRQDLVLLGHGEDNPAAHAFLDYLASESVRRLIRDFGYSIE